MLFKGTPTRSPLDITRAIEGRGGNFNACTGEESTCYYAHVPNEYLGEVVDILSDMYLHAAISADEFGREERSTAHMLTLAHTFCTVVRRYAEARRCFLAYSLEEALASENPSQEDHS